VSVVPPRYGRPVLLQRIAATVFPLRCPGCGRAAEPVCVACAATLRAPQAARPPVGVDAWLAPFAYEGVARELIARVKYRGTHAAVHWLAHTMVREIEQLGIADRIDAVTWTPTTPARCRARGFDHAELLARPIARDFGLPAAELLRRLPGPPQTGLPAAERRRGPEFAVREPAPSTVLLVDDVATTGATLAAAAAALRAGGARRVVAATAARTPRPST